MYKTDFIAMLAENGEMSKVEAAKLYDVFLETMKEALLTEGEIQFHNFFTIRVKNRNAYVKKVPTQEEAVEIPATRRLSVKMGKKFKEELNA